MISIEQLFEAASRHFEARRYAQASELYRAILEIDPDHSAAHYSLGLIAGIEGDESSALARFERAIAGQPHEPAYYYNYATLLHRRARFDEAIRHYGTALSLNPQHAGALNNLGAILLLRGETAAAEEKLRHALRIQPDNVNALTNIGNIRKDQGEPEDAIAWYRRALATDPRYAVAGSNLLLCMLYSNSYSAAQIFKEHCARGRAVSEAISDSIHASVADAHPDRPLRIGYVSPDLRRHSVAYFFEPILAAHNRSLFEIFCYADVAAPDEVSVRFQQYRCVWRSIYGMHDRQAAETIAGDRIDILVDLAGHSGNNRLGVFARKPAPVQITYLGYPATTGLEQIDYRITDSLADPPGEEQYHSERLIRLPGGFLCYRPPQEPLSVSPSPSSSNGFITFGSLNNVSKMCPDVIQTWIRVLRETPDSQLVLKSKVFANHGYAQRLREIFAEAGIAQNRMHLLRHSPSTADHLRVYNRIDISLDTFPYNGTTTTCESLWMGVPVIALRGAHHASRVGVSLLSRIGLSSMVAGNQKEYVRLARFLASDVKRLTKLRESLRPALVRSPVCDARKFTKELESAYRTVWHNAVKPR